MTSTLSRVDALRRALRDPLIANSTTLLATTVLMAAAGSAFWVIAARLQPRSEVGLAGSLVSATVTLSYLSQLGLNITLVRTLPGSRRRAADVATSIVVVSGFCVVLSLAYGLLLPGFSSSLNGVVDDGWKLALFAVLVTATAINLLTDGIFLGLRQVMTNLRINGILMGAAKCAFIFVFAGFGAFGLYVAVGLASALAAIVSVAAILRAVPGRPSLHPSRELWESKRFAGAGYVASVLDMAPQLALPVLIINADGASASALYFVSFQIVTLVNSVCYATTSSMYAEAASAPDQAGRIVRKGAVVTLFSTTAGVVVLLAVSPLLLGVFGTEYADHGVPTLRIFALGVLGVAFNSWSAVRLRIARHLPAMMLVQLFTTVSMIGAAAAVADRGPAWVAGAWGVGQLVGGVTGLLVMLLSAPPPDSTPDGVAPDAAPSPAEETVERVTR